MLVRAETVGQRFGELELRYDAATARLSYRAGVLEALLEDEAAAPNGVHDLLVVGYLHWRSRGGAKVAAMEALVEAARRQEDWMNVVRLEPRLGWGWRWMMAAQVWLGLAE